jgi:hypothetical protein
MAIWHTWLGFFGLLVGLIAPTIIRVPVIWSALTGLVGGVALVTLWNFAAPAPVSCLPMAKGIDILRAYDLSCERQLRENQRNLSPTK